MLIGILICDLYKKVDMITHDSTYRENGNQCRYTLAKEKVGSFTPFVFMLRKNGPYTQVINQLLV